MGAGHLHAEIESRTGLIPTRSHRKGEANPRRPRTMPVWKDDLWCLESPLDEDASLDSHLLWLSETLEPHTEILRELADAGHFVNIFCGYRSDSDQGGFSLSPEALSIISKVPVSVTFSILIHDMGDDE